MSNFFEKITNIILIPIKASVYFLLAFAMAVLIGGGIIKVEASSITVSGTLYSDAGVTNAGSGKTIKIAVGTSTPSVHSTTTNSSGVWSITDIDNTNLSSTTAFTVWLDGDANDATTLVSGYSGSNITSVPVYYNYTIAQATSSSAVVNIANFYTYDNSDDSDILFFTTSTSTVVNSNLLINQGIFKSSTTTLSISGNFTNNASFNANDGIIELTGISKNIDGSLTGSNAFYGLNVSGSYTINSSSASTTNLTISNSGSLVASTKLTISGNFSNGGTFDNNGGTLYMDNTRMNVLNYISGLDANGLSNGTGSIAINAYAVSGNYLYVGKAGSATACSQTAGGAIGCELMVFDVSSSTNPSYVAGRDINGLNNGTSSGNIGAMVISGNYLYITKSGSATACSQTVGSATGCEIQAYNISSSTNPTYSGGVDSAGLSNGTSSQATTIPSATISGNYLYIAKAGNATACSQTAGSADGCELMVFDISSSTNIIYKAGRDAGGTNNGTNNIGILDLETYGNYLYVARGGSAITCSQTASSSIGCELMVFDISSSTNPTYVAGRDADGSGSGSASVNISNISINGNVVYVVKAASSTACSQVSGSAGGCELMVFDVSSSTNPTYVAGRDADGTGTGSVATAFNSLSISSSYLYVVKSGNNTVCSQTSGAQGCELQVYDISSSTNPVYITGMDSDGSSEGSTNTIQINSILVINKYVYIARSTNAVACSQTVSSSQGCELMIFDPLVGVISGNLVGSNTLADVIIKGNNRFVSSASTTDFIVQTNSTSTQSSGFTIGGDYNNEGISIFDDDYNLYFSSASAQNIAGTLVGVSALPNANFIGSGTKTISAIASTTNLNIDSGATVGTNFLTSINGALNNNGTFNSSDIYLLGYYNNSGIFNKDNSSSLNIKSYITKYLSSRDISGDGSGVSSADISDIAINGNYLYAVKSGNTTACSQSAGSAVGCELMVFDISSSTNPTYIAGRDADGSAVGTTSLAVNAITISGNYVYIGKTINSTACSQTAGSAVGCELMVFDISSSTNPTYVAGRDINGSASGAGSNFGIYSLIATSSYLYVGTNSLPFTVTCSQAVGGADGCELQVYDISSSTNPVYKAGMDADGNLGGVSTSTAIISFNIYGNYLYVGTIGSSYACLQTAGSASGCELQVYDISSSTNPVYKAGKDTVSYIYDIAISGQALYIGQLNSSAACSQASGSSGGCELQVYDISSSTNPTFTVGRDVDGSTDGTGNVTISDLLIKGSYLYVAKAANASVCSHSIGSATGCELMVFDISSSTYPIYVYGRDASGQVGGREASIVYTVSGSGNYIYLGKAGNTTYCSQTTSSAIGCELMVFDTVADFSGTLTGASSLGDVNLNGQGAHFLNNASTTNLTIATSATLTAPDYLTIAGDLSNYGTFTHSSGTIILTGTNQDLVSPATTTFYNLTKSVSSADTLTFTAGGTYITQGDLTLNGASGNRLSLRSSSTTGEWYIDPQATATVSYLDVQDSNNINVTTITCTTGCLDSDRNTNWTFSDPVNFVSTDDYHFYVGQATTTLDTITITKSSGLSDIVSTNDMRITIATTTSNFRFDTTNTTLTFGGTASGKVNSTVSYENAGATLVINVTSDFVNEDILTIGGIQVGSFNSLATSSSYLTLYTSGSISGTAIATDTKNIHITGSLTISDHTLDQVDNQFNFQNKNDEVMFAFNLSPAGENATVTDMVITLSGVQEVTSDEISDFKLYRDLDSNGASSGGDELLDGGGILTINGQYGAITFSTDFLATSTSDYIVTFDTSDIDRGDSFVVSLPNSGVTATGLTSVYSSYIISTVSNIQHERYGVGAGGSSGRIGDDAPAGNGIVTGGEEGGGGGVGDEEDGENIAHDPNFIKPSATGDIDNEWTNPSNALNSDNTYATAGSVTLKQSYNGFSFGIPGGNTILGIEVKVDASGSTADGTIDVALSWDGGSSYTTGKATPTLSGTDIIYNVGGSGDTWGRGWTATEFNPTNFRLRVTANPSSNTLRLDALEVRVYHQSTGGGGGGGGGI